MSRLVPGEGNPNAPLHVWGRDPGKDEMAQGRPFVGAAGTVINYALASASLLTGLDRYGKRPKPPQNLYIDNIVQTQPRNNKWELHSPDLVRAGVRRAQGILERLRPLLVVACGNEAFRTVMGEDPNDSKVLPSIQEARGYLWDSPLGFRVLASVHPAACLREWVPWRPLLDIDMQKAAAELALECPPLAERHVEVTTDLARVHSLLQMPQIAIDSENTKDLKLACLGIAANEQEALVIPATPESVPLIREVCESETPKILQNGVYDRYFMNGSTWTDYDITIRNQTVDTLLQWHTLQPELAGKKTKSKKKSSHRLTHKSLRFLASIYTRSPFWKDYDFATPEERYRLCGQDCCITFEVAVKMAKELQEV